MDSYIFSIAALVVSVLNYFGLEVLLSRKKTSELNRCIDVCDQEIVKLATENVDSFIDHFSSEISRILSAVFREIATENSSVNLQELEVQAYRSNYKDFYKSMKICRANIFLLEKAKNRILILKKASIILIAIVGLCFAFIVSPFSVKYPWILNYQYILLFVVLTVLFLMLWYNNFVDGLIDKIESEYGISI